MAQVDHVVDARAKEIVGGGAGKHHGRTPRKQPLLDIKPGVRTIGNHPKTVVCRYGFKTFTPVVPSLMRGESNLLPIDHQANNMPRFMQQVTPGRVEQFGWP
jgi:hypothetical protein